MGILGPRWDPIIKAEEARLEAADESYARWHPQPESLIRDTIGLWRVFLRGRWITGRGQDCDY